MKKKVILLAAVEILLLAGCGAAASQGTGGGADEAEIASNSADEETVTEGTNAEDGDDSAKEYEIKELQNNPYIWQEITITLPDDWIGRCVVDESESGFSIYQKASYERDDASGYICGLFRTQEPVEYDHGKLVIAYTDDGMLYYLVQPTDAPADADDEKIAAEYVRMCQQVPQLKASLQIAAPGVHGNADEYILPTSSIFPLDASMLTDLSDNNLLIARNEIYARHGRQFANGYVQQYFDRCTWYEGKIPPQEFQESSLNQTEKDNLQLLAAAEEEYDRQHPYPKMYQASETVSEDLDGDGTMDRISYQVTQQEGGQLLGVITVNDNIYIANELSDSVSDAEMTDLIADSFYVTDILENDGLLEIALLDEGPSEDPITYFFQYNGTLSCIGQVPGFPFADRNDGINGFNGYGGITGRSRIDLIETAYVRDYRWYDGSRIVDLGTGWYDFLPSFGHVLYEDLPVYCEWDETSATTVIPAQEEVFFLGTDRERWILVKGKDGSQGYMLLENGKIMELNKPAEEVFGGLHFSG